MGTLDLLKVRVCQAPRTYLGEHNVRNEDLRHTGAEQVELSDLGE
jgi:hypothetical protein